MNQESRLDAIFFDVDGVLIDSMQVKAEAFALTFGDVPGEHDRVIAFHHAHGGVTRSEKIRQLFKLLFLRSPTPVELQARIDAFAAAVLDGVIAAPEIAGAHAVVLRWSKHTKLHAVSATPNDELHYVFEQRGLTQFFASIHGWPPLKELAVSALIQEHGYRASRCLMVGDSLEDLKAAQANALAFIQVGAAAVNAFPTTAAIIPDLTAFDAAVNTVLSTIEQ